ncbi:MAG: hypothetical protein ABWY05_15170 [Noviherbaspirillum sp.]
MGNLETCVRHHLCHSKSECQEAGECLTPRPCIDLAKALARAEAAETECASLREQLRALTGVPPPGKD